MPDAVPTPEGIQPDWLGTVLASRGFTRDIAAIRREKIGTGQVGATFRYILTHAEGDDSTLVGKFPALDTLSRATGKSHLTYIRESRFYQQFAGQKPLPIPTHYFIGFDDETHDFALIMEDYPHHIAGNQLVTPRLEEAKHAMRAAAKIHAAWWGDPMLDTLDWLNGTRAIPPAIDVEALYTLFWPGFCDRFGDQVSPEMRRVGEAYLGKISDWTARQTGPRCLTHNDFRPDNMLYNLADPERPVIIVDWQTVGVGSGAGDIAYYMGTALDPAFRRAEERGLCDLYAETLSANGVPTADTTNLWESYRIAAFSGFLMGVTASMVVQQTDRGDAMFLAMCERAASMVLDHADIALPA
jgi:hypothetical protein